MKTQQCVSTIILNKNQEVLFCKRSMEEDFMPGVWDIPGGGLEEGEDLIQGLKREVSEECGMEVEIGDEISKSSYIMHDIQRIETTYLASAITTDVKLNNEHTEFRWVRIEDFESLGVTDYVMNILNNYKAIVSKAKTN